MMAGNVNVGISSLMKYFEETQRSEISIAICLPSEVTLDGRSLCLKECPRRTYMFRQICYEECPVNSNAIVTELGKFCTVNHEFECQRISCPDDFPLCYKMNCLKTCPKYTFQFLNTCVIECPNTHAFKISHECEGRCLPGKCLDSCPPSHPFVFESIRSKHCLQQCPNYTYENKDSKSCISECPLGSPFLFNKTCLKTCPESHAFVSTVESMYNSISKCSDSCPSEAVIDGDYCVRACPRGKHLFNNTCFATCPTSHPLKFPNTLEFVSPIKSIGKSDFICVDSCNLGSNSIHKYNLEYNDFCIDSCPQESHYAYNGSCWTTCPASSKYNMIHGNYFLCVEFCPVDKFVSNETNCRRSCPPDENFLYNKSCHIKCPSEANYRRLDSYLSHYECYEKCPENNVVFNHTTCVTNCPDEARYESNGTCVAQCQGKLQFELSTLLYYSDFTPIYHYSCRSECPPEKHFVSGNECVKDCPSARKYLFNNTCNDACPSGNNFKQIHGSHYKCLAACPSETFIHNDSICVASCPPEAKYQYKKTCVTACSSPLNYRLSNSTTISVNWYKKKTVYHHYCLEDCPSNTNYFEDACLMECPSQGNYLYNRSCYKECPVPHNYSFLRGKHHVCFDECPQNTYTYNASMCLSACPADKNFEFNNTCYNKCPDSNEFIFQDGSFFKCMDKCSSNSLLTLNKTCLKQCPQEARFQDDGLCVQDCKDGRRKYKFRNFTMVSYSKKSYHYYCLDACPVNTFELNFTCVTHCSQDTLELDNKCVLSCPRDRPLNYTTNDGKHSCQHSCPYRTYKFKRKCFDRCPAGFRTHLFTCTLECPTSHPYTDIVTQKCLSTCENDFVLTDNYVCDKKCPHDKKYIEKKMCVKSCKNRNSLFHIAKQGIFCYDRCPHHLLQMENKGTCVEKCPNDKLIVGSTCRAIYKCPNHKYLEHTGVGKRCTNKCSSGYFLDGVHCVKECPHEKVIVNAMCAEECPPSQPLIYKDFTSSKLRGKCYSECPDGHVANGSICIEEYTCHSAKHYTFEHVCYEACPTLTGISETYTCSSLIKYIIYTVSLCIITLILLVVVYFLTRFTGFKFKKKKEVEDAMIKTHFQLLSSTKDKEKNIKYVIRYEKEDKEKENIEILEVNDEKMEGNEDVTELNDGYKPIAYRRRKNVL